MENDEEELTSDERLDKQLAELLGWHGIKKMQGVLMGMVFPMRAFVAVNTYTQDLDIVHKIERTLSEEQFEKYRWLLWYIAKEYSKSVKDWQRAYLSSSARDRVRALIVTLDSKNEEIKLEETVSL
jgi:hypothetical protein